ncbi:MAG: RNase H family protein [Pirellulales bacterium]
MKAATPHYLLFSESRRQREQGQWRFVLQSVDGSQQFEAADDEPDVAGERLELLAVVRGLEALEQPSRVTLVTPSKYVNRGLTYGLDEWRANDWQWEHYGEMVPVKNRDLWQRVDRALLYHQLDCRTWRFDLPHGTADGGRIKARGAHTVCPARHRWFGGRPRGALAACKRWCEDRVRGLRSWMAERRARLAPVVRFE